MRAIGIIATSAMRVRMAPPFVGRAKAPSSARCWRAPAIAFGPRTASGKASSVLASRHRVCGRFCYAQDCVVKTPLISSLVGVGGSIKVDLDNREDDLTAPLFLIRDDFPVGWGGIGHRSRPLRRQKPSILRLISRPTIHYY